MANAQNALPEGENPTITEAMPVQSSPLEGLWLTQNERSVIKIESCMQGLCGTVHWITQGGMQRDSKNPDASKSDKPMCGLPILWGFEQDSETKWEDGTIYKADEGKTYSSKLELLDENTLKVRGYVGFSFLGETQQWTRVSEENYPSCGI
ncbi:MAG: DUF2147 domain-containing protein [Alphaproteobacteria bacterium]